MSHSHKSLIEIHEEVPADHYDKGLKINLFQRIWHMRRFSEVSRVVKPVEGRFLDVGCHGGTFTKIVLSKIGSKDLYGIDISKPAIEYIKKKIPYGHFQAADVQQLPFKDNFFDAVFCLEVLEHVDDPEMALKEIKRVLKKDGYGVVLVPSESKLFRIVWFVWTMYYPIWRHAHVQNFNGKKLDQLIDGLGLKILLSKNFNLGMLKLVMFEKE